ncbi:MAG: ABC transporter ATP-binding protein [Thermoanaerobaculia bacterium]|nr:ABC transporter ATP-binding protein [Thermoanaerobaculia bacterium]
MPKQYSQGGRAASAGAGAAGASGGIGRAVDGRAPRSLRQRFSALGNLRPFLRLIWEIHPGLALATLLLRLLRALLPVATLFVGKWIIDEVLRLTHLPGAPTDLAGWLASGHLRPLLGFLGLELALAVLSDVVGRIVSLLESLLGERFANTASIRLMEHAATLDLEDFEDSEVQDQLDRARRQASGRSGLLSQLLGQAQDIVSIAAFAAGLTIYAPWLIVLLAFAVIPAFLGESHFNAQSYELAWRRTPAQRELDYVRATGASVETAKEVKIFGLNAFLIARYRVLADEFYRANRALAVRRAGWGGLLTTVGTIGYYGAYAYLAWRTVSGALTIGDLTFLSASFRRLRNLLEGLLIGFSQVAGQALYLDDLFSFFDLRPEIVSPPNPLPFPEPIRTGFVFEDVGFRYPGAERWAVRHLTFELRAGEVLALVGENGAGKTTLVKLLSRLYEPDEGRILLDGRDLRDYDLGAVRGHIGVIFQDFVRYHLTAGENIAVGRIEARGDRERIREAARRSLADEVIERLPAGYDQLIGRRFKTGVELSGGEWQKIAIARAYMRQADVLILDEPTAALDARSEFEVFQRFAELSLGKTAILISHRFSTVRRADRILVLADGRIEAAGTHDELIEAGGRYAELFDLQAAGFR